MYRILAAFALASAVAFPALADNAEGMITSIDREALTVTLDDGNTYRLPAELDMSGFEEGATIVIAYDQVGDERQITDFFLEE